MLLERSRSLLCLLLCAVMLLLASCKGGGGQTVTSRETEEPIPPAITYPLKDFQIVLGDSYTSPLTPERTKVRDDVNLLRNELKVLNGGEGINLRSDILKKEERPCELLIGATKRQEYKDVLATLAEDQYTIRAVETETGVKIVIAAHTDDALRIAIRKYTVLVKNGTAVSDQATVQLLAHTESAEASIGENVIRNLVFICQKGVDSMVVNAVNSFRSELGQKYGVTPKLVRATSTQDLSQYPYAIVIGACGENATLMKEKLTERCYQISAEYGFDSYRVTLVGWNDIAALRALQYFYSQSVVNGQLVLPAFMEAKIAPMLVRDPCIVPYNGMYYLYSGTGSGYGVQSSSDLLTWSARTVVFSQYGLAGFDGDTNYWAPECHIYKGNFYLFATYHSTVNDHRGVAIFRSKTPTGTFELISKNEHTDLGVGHITPHDWDAIDGTLYVDENGKPWMVFVYEWTSTSDGIGRMAYAPLSDDLTEFLDTPKIMFKANDAPWSNRQVTDGCYLYRCEDGTLLMIWSNMADGKGIGRGYTVGIAKSSNGRLDGTWTQVKIPLFNENNRNVYCTVEGGHGMIFQSFDGRLYLAIHTPNSGEDTAMTLVPIVERNGMLYADLIF